MISYRLRTLYIKIWKFSLGIDLSQMTTVFCEVSYGGDYQGQIGGLQNEVQTSLSHFCKKSLDVQSDYFRDLM